MRIREIATKLMLAMALPAPAFAEPLLLSAPPAMPIRADQALGAAVKPPTGTSVWVVGDRQGRGLRVSYAITDRVDLVAGKGLRSRPRRDVLEGERFSPSVSKTFKLGMVMRW